MTERQDPNWAQVSPLLPLATLADSYDGPVLLADETRTIRWFVAADESRGPVEHREHARDDQGAFLHHPRPEPEEGEEAAPEADQEPVVNTRTVAPAFWAMVEIIE